MKNILVAYDGSAPARRALETAADLALAMGAKLTIVGVVPEELGLPILMDPFDDTTVHAKQLKDAIGYLEGRGIDAETLEPRGDPAKEIEKIARSGGYDTVVLGSRGLGAAGRLVLGSVSAHIATHSGGTVVIVN